MDPIQNKWVRPGCAVVEVKRMKLLAACFSFWVLEIRSMKVMNSEILYIKFKVYSAYNIYPSNKKTNLEIQQPSMAMKPLYTIIHHTSFPIT